MSKGGSGLIIQMRDDSRTHNPGMKALKRNTKRGKVLKDKVNTKSLLAFFLTNTVKKLKQTG